MKEQTRQSDLDMAHKVALKFAHFLKKFDRFKDKNVEDLTHTLLCEIVPGLEHFDPDKGTKIRYIQIICKRRCFNLFRNELTREKRKGTTLSFEDVEENYKQLAHEYLSVTPDCESRNIKADIDGIIDALPSPMGYLSKLLKFFTITEVAYIQDRTRQSIYRDIKNLRKSFQPLTEDKEENECL